MMGLGVDIRDCDVLSRKCMYTSFQSARDDMHIRAVCMLACMCMCYVVFVSHADSFFPKFTYQRATCAHLYIYTSFKSNNTINMTIIILVITINTINTTIIIIFIMIVTFGSPLAPLTFAASRCSCMHTLGRRHIPHVCILLRRCGMCGSAGRARGGRACQGQCKCDTRNKHTPNLCFSNASTCMLVYASTCMHLCLLPCTCVCLYIVYSI